MSFYRDKEIRGYWFFLFLFALLILGMGFILCTNQIGTAKVMYLTHDEAVASSLLAQGVSKDVIAVALTNTESSTEGRKLLDAMGIWRQTENGFLPFISQYQRAAVQYMIIITIISFLALFVGTLVFFKKRNQLYLAGAALQFLSA